MLNGGSQLNQQVISDLVKRHRSSGLAAVGRAAAGMPRGTYDGLVVESQSHTDQWQRSGSHFVLEVTTGPHAGTKISVDARGPVAKLLAKAAATSRPVRFDVYIKRYNGGRQSSQVNLETIRWASADTSGGLPEPKAGLPAHVREIMFGQNATRRDNAGGPTELISSVGPVPAAAKAFSAYDITVATATYRHGFACVGAKNVIRKLVPWHERYKSLAGCTDPSVLGQPVYLSLYLFTEDLVTYVQNHEKAGSMAGYRGGTYSPLVVIDIDRKDAANRPEPMQAFVDTSKLLVVLLELGIPADCIRVSFSGSKGFHIDFPSMLTGAMPAFDFPQTQKAFCSMIAAEADIEIDTSIYNTLHSLRAPNSRHEDSGIYKVSMSTAEFLELSLDQIQSLATKPRVFSQPCFIWEPIPSLWELWKHAEQVAHHVTRRPGRDGGTVGGDARIWQSTWQFLVNGAPDGERAVATFKAAANLAHFGSVEDLIRALLSRGVRLCGLPPNEATAHIDSALRRAGESRILDQIEYPAEC